MLFHSTTRLTGQFAFQHMRSLAIESNAVETGIAVGLFATGSEGEITAKAYLISACLCPGERILQELLLTRCPEVRNLGPAFLTEYSMFARIEWTDSKWPQEGMFRFIEEGLPSSCSQMLKAEGPRRLICGAE
jgi:hypothetical protein